MGTALPVPSGTPLLVTVPTGVSAAPWQVGFVYQLFTAEVQRYGAAISTGPNGIEFATRATWVLSVRTGRRRGRPATPRR